MPEDMTPRVYFSYKWGGEGERIVDAIDAALKAAGIPFVRDKADLGYRGRIGSFMQEIGRGSCVIVVICDKYLTSPNTMFELVEMAKNADVHDRIFPVVLSDADIYDAARRIRYVKYWEDKKKELGDAMRSVDLANLQGITDDLNLYDSIRDHVSRMTSLLKDMNTLTPEMHRNAQFAHLIEGLRARLETLAPGALAPADEGAGEDAGEGAGEGAGDELQLTPLMQALAADLLALMDDNVADGLMVFAGDGNESIDLALFTTRDDGGIECRLPSNEQLPKEIRLPASARRELVTRFNFAAPDEPGGDYLFITEPADDFICNDMAGRVIAALVEVYGVPEDAIAWRALPDPE